MPIPEAGVPVNPDAYAPPEYFGARDRIDPGFYLGGPPTISGPQKPAGSFPDITSLTGGVAPTSGSSKYASDPAYQQWLATLGFMQDDLQRRQPVTEGRILDSADFAREGLGINRFETLRGIGSALENRGLTRSGEHERRRAEALRDSNRRFGALEMRTSNQLADSRDRLASELADYQRRDASQRFNAANRAGSRQGRDAG